VTQGHAEIRRAVADDLDGILRADHRATPGGLDEGDPELVFYSLARR
jgi:hypothetical protein